MGAQEQYSGNVPKPHIRRKEDTIYSEADAKRRHAQPRPAKASQPTSRAMRRRVETMTSLMLDTLESRAAVAVVIVGLGVLTITSLRARGKGGVVTDCQISWGGGLLGPCRERRSERNIRRGGQTSRGGARAYKKLPHRVTQLFQHEQAVAAQSRK